MTFSLQWEGTGEGEEEWSVDMAKNLEIIIVCHFYPGACCSHSIGSKKPWKAFVH
jgi:hypothetical protein